MSEPEIREISFFIQSGEMKTEVADDVKEFMHSLLESTYKKDSYLLNYIFVSSEDIHELNNQYLGHDYPTDVITFDFSEDFGVFGGDIFICPEVVFENAGIYNALPEEELLRVICHGMLHLLGYDDKTEQDKTRMLEQEEYCLEMFRSR